MHVSPEGAGFGSSLYWGLLLGEDFVGVTVVPGTHVNIHVHPPGTCPLPYNRYQGHIDG